MLDVVSGREGLTGAQERPGQEQQLAHDGSDDDLGTLTFGTQALGEGTQWRIAAHGHDGWQVQGLAQGCGTERTDVAATADRGAGAALLRAEADVRGDLTRCFEAI